MCLTHQGVNLVLIRPAVEDEKELALCDRRCLQELLLRGRRCLQQKRKRQFYVNGGNAARGENLREETLIERGTNTVWEMVPAVKVEND